MGHTALSGMNRGSTKMLLVDVLTGNSLHHLRTCQEHVTRVLHHQGEVGQSRGVNSTTGARTKDTGYLGYHTRGQNVALKNLGIACKSVHGFLNTGTTRVVDTDNRSTHLHTHVHHLANLLGHRLGKRTAIHSEVLGKYVYQTTVHRTGTGYNTVTKILLLLHAEIVATVKLEHVELFKTAFVQKHVDSFTRGVLAACMLFVNGFLATTKTGLLTFLYKRLDLF